MEESSIIIYQTEDGLTKIEARLLDETVWLTQAQLCELFQKSKATISEHIKNIFEEGELDEISVVRNFRTTATEVIYKHIYAQQPNVVVTDLYGTTLTKQELDVQKNSLCHYKMLNRA